MKLKKFLAVVLASVMILSSIPFASLAGIDILAQAEETAMASGTCGDNLTWVLYDNGTLVIEGTGEMSYYDNYGVYDVPWHSYSEDILHVIIGDGVTGIGNSAFCTCYNLESIKIPDSVTSIGDSAFYECTNLESIDMSDSITSIGDIAFYYCSSLESIEIPASVTTIGNDAFRYCYMLERITVDALNENYSSDEHGVLFDKNKTTLIQFPLASTLTEYTVPDSVINIGAYVFYECCNLESIEIPDSVTSIGDRAFCFCESLESIEIPASVTTIGNDAFRYCYMLERITVDALNENYSSDEHGVLFDKNKTTLIQFPLASTVTEYTVPDSVTTIGALAFYYCTSLESIEIPDSVTSISEFAFNDCYNLESITILNPECEIYDSESTIYYETKIIGQLDSTAQAYAENYDREFEILCNHNFDSGVVTEPTCTQDGYTTYTCSDCGYSYKDDYVALIGHTDENNDNICEVCGNNLSDILVGETKCIDVIEDEITYLKFIPEKDGKYTFYSSSDADTYGYLFDADKNQLTSNDDGIEDGNFYIEYELEAGKTYYWGARFYSYASGSFDVTLEFDCTHSDPDFDGICNNCGESSIIARGTYGDNLTWIIYGDTLVISGAGEMDDYDYYGDVPWYNYNNYISYVIIENGVTSIGENAFSCLQSLMSATIPESVISIGEDAFGHCSALESIIIPASVINIGDYAFYCCDSLKNITIPVSVMTIGKSTFLYCDSLESITVDENNTYYSSDAYGVLFNKNKTELIQYPIGNIRTSYFIPESVTIIGERAFYECTNLESITIPESVISIGEDAFHYCSALESIIIPSSVINIGDDAFSFCSNLKNISLGDSVTTIGEGAFHSCSALESVTIPDSVTSIGDSAFDFCKNLKQISIGKSVTSIGGTVTGVGDEAFRCCLSLESIMVDVNNAYYSSDAYGVLFDKNKTILIRYPAGNARTEYFVPDSVITIDDYAFEYCVNLESIIMPDSVTSIGYSAFTDCSSLVSITIPDSLTIIRNMTFCFCPNLESITIPSTITSIGPMAFAYCSNLESITIFNPKCEIDDASETIYSSATIVGYSDSTAQEYAEKYDRTFKVIGEETEEHDFDSVVTEPTCTEDGYTTYTCSDCGYSYTDSVVDALGHDPVSYTQSAACEVTGYSITTCSRCYEELSFAILDSIGHDWDDGVVTTVATCVVKEQKLYTCKRDASHTKTEIGDVAPDNHTGGTYLENKKDAFCTEDGYTGDTYCNACKQLIAKGEGIRKLGHNMEIRETIKAATLLEEGQEKVNCTRCDYSETRSIPKLEGTKTEDEQFGVSVEYTSDAYDEDVVIKVEEVYDGSQYLTQQYTNIISWNIKTYVGDTEVQPDTPVLVRIPLPASYNTSAVAVYHINSETGKRERVQPVIIEDGYICFFANSFSIYILVDESSAVTEESDPSANCSHMCHKSGLNGFIWKIVQFFWKLFNMNPVCECGAAHY